MKRSLTSIMAAAAMMVATGASAQTTYFFSPDGNGEMDGSSWENAAPSEYLGEAVANAAEGDAFYLMAGKYKAPTNLGNVWTIPNGITLKGGYPATMTGTDVAITYPAENYSIFSADIEGDGVGDNGTTAFVTVGVQEIDGVEVKKEDVAKTLIAGITFRDAFNSTDRTYHGSAMVCDHVNIELDHCQFINNTIGTLVDGALKGAGAATVFRGSFVYAHDCVWADNIGTRAGSAIMVRAAYGNSGNKDNEAKGTNSAKSVVYLDRCEISNNNVIDPNNGSAKYGGTMSIGDYCGDLYMNNCTVEGLQVKLQQAGAAIRVGGGDKFVCMNTTFFGFDCLSTSWTSGDAVSLGSDSQAYFANSIAVQEADGAEAGTKFTCVYHQAGGAMVSGGHNVFGSLTSEIDFSPAATDDIQNTNVISTVFGTNEYAAAGGNGTKVIAPNESYRGMTLTDLKAFNDTYGAQCLDVTLDQRGLARPEVTISGAYDINATVVAGIEDIVAESDAEVIAVEYYNIQGQKLNAAPENGLYIQKAIKADGTVKASKLVK